MSSLLLDAIGSRASAADSEPPLVSVVIPAFNAERYIRTAVTSVLSQTHPNLELVVVDDGSRDATADVIAGLQDQRVQLLRTSNQGPSRARNEGFARTRGPYVAFLDSDDYWLPHKLAAQLDAFARDPQLVALGSRMRYVSPSGSPLGVAGHRVNKRNQRRVAEGKLNPFPLSSILFRRSAVEAVGGFDVSLRQTQDFELISTVSLQGPISCLPEVLGGYRLHSQSISATEFESQRLEMRFIRERRKAERVGRTLTMEEFLERHRPRFTDRWRDLVASQYRQAGLNVAQRRWIPALFYGLQAALLGPAYTLPRVLRQRPWARGDDQDAGQP